METAKLQKLKSQLYSDTPFIGESRRKQAALELKKDGSPLAIKVLLATLTDSDDLNVQNIALEAVKAINDNQGCINAVCASWAETRNQELTKLLKLRGWVATAPVEVKVLSALKVPRREFITEGKGEILEPLLQALEDVDEEIAQTAKSCAIALTNTEAINNLCQKWVEKRDSFLEAIIIEGKYIATQPIEVKILTALKLGNIEVLAEEGAEIIKPLLQACEDQDSEIAKNAQEALQKLKNPAAETELCRLVIEEQNEIAQKITLAAEYAPSNPESKAVFYFLTQQWEKYQNSDPQHSFLEKVYLQANEETQKRISEIAQLGGRLEWVQVVVGKQGKRLQEMTDREWQTTIEVLKTGKHWEQIWKLSHFAAPIWSKQLLQQLKDVEWTPKESGFEKLLGLAEKCSRDIPSVGGVRPHCNALLNGHKHWVNCIAISPDGKILVSGGGVGDKTVCIWNLLNGEKLNTLKGHTSGINCLAITPDGKILVTGGTDGSVRLWQLPDGKPLKILNGHTNSILCMAMNSEGSLLATGSKDHTVHLWKLPDGEPIKTLEGHTASVWSLAINPDGTLLASGGGTNDKTVRLWKLPSGEAIATLEGHNDSISCLGISSIIPDAEPEPEPEPAPKSISRASRFLKKSTAKEEKKVQQFLVSGSYDHTVRLWELPEGNLLATLEGHTDLVQCLAVSSDGKLLSTGTWGRDKTVKLWQLPDGELKGTIVGHEDAVLDLAISPDNLVLATGSKDKTLRLWSLPAGEAIATIEGHTNSVKAIAFSADGQLLATGSWDKTVRVWSSKLSSLVSAPQQKLSPQNKKWIEETLQNQNITQNERNWLEFLLALGTKAN